MFIKNPSNRTLKQRVFFFLPWLIVLVVGCAIVGRKGAPLPARETVVLLHGLGRSGHAMWLLEDRLEKSGYEVIVLDYQSIGVDMDTPIASVSSQINEQCRDKGVVHFVGHSLGGLMIRSYFSRPENQYMLEKLGRVVMIGTPNSGTLLVDLFKEKWWMCIIGDTAKALGTDATGLPSQLPAPPFKAGIIAGSNGSFISDAFFREPNDGLVPVASTQLSNMADFIIVDVTHSMMRYNEDVARQTIWFLKNGSFKKD